MWASMTEVSITNADIAHSQSVTEYVKITIQELEERQRTDTETMCASKTEVSIANADIARSQSVTKYVKITI